MMDDLISREDALKVCEKYNGQGYVWSCIRGDIERLPSAQPDLEEDEDIPMEYFENGGI